jgi:hypothetical protein
VVSSEKTLIFAIYEGDLMCDISISLALVGWIEEK